MNRKLIVSDYDGTFFLNEKEIKENVKNVNKFREKNNLFIIATGNNLKRFEEVISKYNIKYDYLILDQGACIFDNKRTLLKDCFIDYDVSKEIMNEVIQTKKEYKICNAYNDEGNIEEKNITKIGVDFINLEEAFVFNEKINKKYSDYINAYTMIFDKINIVEIISNKTDKNEAIKFVAKKENITKENIYTVGDGYNDISMIQNFNGFCMENAVEELHKKCKNRVASVSELINKLI